jgi:hypothetical protein
MAAGYTHRFEQLPVSQPVAGGSCLGVRVLFFQGDTTVHTDDTTTVEDPAVDDIPADQLPGDDEEFASPPTALATTATEPE